MKTKIKLLLKQLIALASLPFIVLWFWPYRWLKQNVFLYAFKSKALGGPSLLSLPFVYMYHYGKQIYKIIHAVYNDYVTTQYSRLIKQHYSKEGLGYYKLFDRSEQECLDLFNSFTGRIALYIEQNKTMVTYKDGESFLDVGCGMGQNIKELTARYPNSKVTGFDVNEAALRVIKVATKGRNVHVEAASALDPSYLSKFPDGAFDHVIISHVFAFLLEAGVENTKKKRQDVVDQLIRISKKSFVMMDEIHHNHSTDIKINVSQSTRCFLIDPVAQYFYKHKKNGELYMMFGPEMPNANSAIIFKKNS